jgi:EAL domain-containing protein (putative c-di-GMP-specific phosphodiesterase class I)
VNSPDNAAERLLVLDDTAEVAELVGSLAEQAGFAATVTTDLDAFNAALERNPPDVIVLDLQMPGTDGIQVLRQLSAGGSTAKILLLTGMDQSTMSSAERFGRQAGLHMVEAMSKPFEPEKLVAALKAQRSMIGQLTPEDLSAAMDDSTLVLSYQPVVRHLGNRNWHAESVEALPRWQHRTLGLLNPGQFLPLISSDRSDLMRQLTDFVLQRGAEQLRQWQNDGLHLGLRVNVPGGLIADAKFPDRLAGLLDEYGIDPALLTLEISDASKLGQTREGIEILTRLRIKAIRLALDDFGAPGASMQDLYLLPINEVKLDRCLTSDIVNVRGASALFEGLVNIARSLGITSCAKCVESIEQLNMVAGLKCDLAQGFHIATPVPASEIPKVLMSWTADAAGRRVAR